MRVLVALALVAGCTDSSDPDTAYRRLVDQFDTYDQCVQAKPIVSCYQTFVLCQNGRVMVDLENRPLSGTFERDGAVVTAHVEGSLIIFNEETRTSSQMPGKHGWEVAMPSFYGCE